MHEYTRKTDLMYSGTKKSKNHVKSVHWVYIPKSDVMNITKI